ncbi:MAG TPA: helix-turn-helix transcriptional regulator [Agriterribacter sp.]|nr:helix-turn-helix transcriptional regulator [Agriterribacter sp.]HRQ50310.1 helix-turn-helix transcriptional regulator [Agriterribacter sp.]
MKISKKIALIRKEKGLTQEELAESANVTVRTIQRIESGESIPRAFTIKALARALGSDFEDLANEVPDSSPSNNSAIHNNPDIDKEKHFLKMLCLSCFGYLVIPLVHFLIPVYLLKKGDSSNPATITFARTIIRQQIYWVTMLCFFLMLTLAYNFIVVLYFKESYLMHYLWSFFGMYILNAFILINRLWRVHTINFKFILAT